MPKLNRAQRTLIVPLCFWPLELANQALREARSSLWLERLCIDVKDGGGLRSVGKGKMLGITGEISFSHYAEGTSPKRSGFGMPMAAEGLGVSIASWLNFRHSLAPERRAQHDFHTAKGTSAVLLRPLGQEELHIFPADIRNDFLAKRRNNYPVTLMVRNIRRYPAPDGLGSIRTR
jgi:hypothetical protein